jgi:hypothetical protein
MTKELRELGRFVRNKSHLPISWLSSNREAHNSSSAGPGGAKGRAQRDGESASFWKTISFLQFP